MRKAVERLATAFPRLRVPSSDEIADRVRTLVAAVLGVIGAAAVASAQAPGGVRPIYHGLLDIVAAHGRFDVDTGDASLRVRRWRFLPSPSSDGIFPDREPVLIALGDNSFLLPAGSVERSRNGRVFRFRAMVDAAPQPIRMFRLVARRDGSYSVSFTLVDLVLTGLLFQDPICLPMAVIVGDDDGFSGADLTRRTFSSPHLRLAGACSVGSTWPWLQ